MSDPTFCPRDIARHHIRRAREGRHFMPPIEEIVTAILFIVAQIAARLDIGIAAYVIMGNHLHFLIFDQNPESDEPSRLDDFVQTVNTHIAKNLGNFWEITGAKFDPDSRNQKVLLGDAAAELQAAAYIITNPTEAGIVADPYLFERAVSHPDMYETPLVIKRPKRWFSSRNWDDEAFLLLSVPTQAALEGYSAESWRIALEDEVERQRRVIIRKRRKEGKRGWLGMVRAREMTPDRKKPLEKGGFSQAKPTAGCDRVLARLFKRIDRFLRQYRAARNAVLNGDENVVFPYGTSRMTRRFGFAMRTRALAL